MGPLLIILGIFLLLTKKNKKKNHRRHSDGKSDWEHTCEDGGGFYGW